MYSSSVEHLVTCWDFKYGAYENLGFDFNAEKGAIWDASFIVQGKLPLDIQALLLSGFFHENVEGIATRWLIRP